MKSDKVPRYGGLKKGDFDLLFHLSSLRQALCSSVCDPVVVPSEIGSSERRGAFSYQFWDTINDEEGGLNLMRGRIANSYSDIINHIEIYQRFRDCFYSVDEALNTSSRKSVISSADVISCGLEILKNLIGDHRERLGGEAFLNYPTCLSGHYFMIQGINHSVVPSKVYNPTQDRNGFLEELELGRTLVESFSYRQRALPSLSISDILDCGEGMHDSSLRGRLEVTKELLRRAGMNVPVE